MWPLSLLLLYGWGQDSQTRLEAAIRQTYEAGEQALQRDDLSAAEKSFIRVLQLAPQDVGARVNLGVVFMHQRKWARALDYLGQAEKLAPQVTGIRLNIGLAYYREGEYAKAIPPFESVLRDQPDSVQASHLLGLSYLFEERYAEAAKALEVLWPISNSDLSYLYSLSVAAGNAGRHDLEERALARLLEVGDNSALFHLLVGKAYLSRDQNDKALEELSNAAQADPKLPLVHYNLGVAYRRLHDLKRAREEFLADVAIEPGVAYNYDQLGAVSYSFEQTHDAELYFQEALKRDRKLGTSWFGLAKIYKQEKRYPEALKALNAADLIDGRSASVHYLRAQIFQELGRKSESQSEMNRVRQLKLESLDKLEREVTDTAYRDPQITSEQY